MTKVSSIACLLLAALLAACSKRQEPVTNAMYYWSTTFDIDSAKTLFMQQHHVQKLYIRYFDVIVDDGTGELMPNASIRFPVSREGGNLEPSHPRTPVPPKENILGEKEIVPTIFIVNDVMRKNTDGLAEKILKRVMQMNETHGIKNVHELQIDCDWSVKTRQRFFAFMKELHQLAQKEGLRLSATIRLHQLAQKPPSCDRGILMMYNTGDFSNFDDEHPILDMKVVHPYLQHLKSYSLPLATAYPIFAYDVVFREFSRSEERGERRENSPKGGEKSSLTPRSPLPAPRYIYIGLQHFDGEIPVMAGDTIVRRYASFDEVMQVRRAIDKLRPDANREVILFDLNSTSITRFKHNEYEEIFGH